MPGSVHVIEAVVALLITGGIFLAFARGGRWRDWERGATLIFDEDEPMGRMTDAFPAGRRKARTESRPAES